MSNYSNNLYSNIIQKCVVFSFNFMYVPAVLMKFIHHEGNRSTKIQYAARAENNKI